MENMPEKSTEEGSLATPNMEDAFLVIFREGLS
jgi:hypothetical protein